MKRLTLLVNIWLRKTINYIVLDMWRFMGAATKVHTNGVEDHSCHTAIAIQHKYGLDNGPFASPYFIDFFFQSEQGIVDKPTLK